MPVLNLTVVLCEDIVVTLVYCLELDIFRFTMLFLLLLVAVIVPFIAAAVLLYCGGAF